MRDRLKSFFKRVLKLFVVFALLYGIGKFTIYTYDSYLFVPRAPYTVMETKDSITIKWNTPEFEVGSIEYGFFADRLDRSISESKKTKKHSLTISGLNECTKYYYRVLSDSMSIDNEQRSFKTLCQTKDKQRVWIIGNSGRAGEDQKRVYNSMLKYIQDDFSKLDMWLLLGNNAHSKGSQKEYNESFFKPYADLLKRFTPWILMGKDDAKRGSFYDIFDFPAEGESGGVASSSERFYSVDSGNLHLVMLDSEVYRLDKNSDLVVWLRQDLEKNTKPWVVVAIHAPPYRGNNQNSSSKKIRENLVPIFDKFGVDLVLSAGSKSYERSKLMANQIGERDAFNRYNIIQDSDSFYEKSVVPSRDSGSIYIVCGSSSSKAEKATPKHPALPFAHKQMGSLILEITPTTLNSKFLSVDGEILDKFTIKKEEI